MKKKLKKVSIFSIILIAYLILGSIFHIFIPCPIHSLTNLYCPGCGITRMLLSLCKLDFYQAFRYNPLAFIMLPIFIFYFIDYIISLFKNKKALYTKINSKVCIVLIIIFIVYGIARNIYLPLAPTVVN